MSKRMRRVNKYIIVLKLLAVNHFLYDQTLNGDIFNYIIQ